MAANSPPLAELTSDYNRYRQTVIKYPDTVESLAHLMMFNINVNEYSMDRGLEDRGTITRRQALRQNQPGIQGTDFATGMGFSVNGTDIANGINNTIGGESAVINDTLSKVGQIQTSRKTKRITTAIALYVPDTVLFDDAQNYENISLTEAIGGVGASIGAHIGLNIGGTGGALAGAAFGILGGAVGRALTPGGAVGNMMKNAATLAPKLVGFAVNPMIEVIYKQPTLRSFQFDFNFAPRNASESQSVLNIIKQFRRHQAPEFNMSSGIAGAAFIPPSEFDISFHMNTGAGFTENINLPKISTCILKTVNTNYSPQMFATFVDGRPINITLRLSFQELDMITRERVDMGF